MKKSLFFLVIFLISIVAISDVNKFRVTFSITFDEITLEEAAKIEKRILKQFKDDSCEIKIELGDNSTAANVIPKDWWYGNTQTLEYREDIP